MVVVIKASLSTGLKGLRRHVSHASSRLTFSVTIALHSFVRGGPSLTFGVSEPYRCYSKLRTRIVVGSYGRASPRSIGPPYV